MPRRDDIQTVLIIGSGPIVIGQACEFDYSGTQACKALRALGYRIVLVNSNPATIMTDPLLADATYIEPLDVDSLTRIIEKERPDALLPNLGGQTALNLSFQLAKAGVLERCGVRVIGVDLAAIEKGEDRTEFKKMMEQIGVEMPRSEAVTTVDEAKRVAASLGYPVVVRPAYTMGGTGGGLVKDEAELEIIAGRGLAASFVHQVLIEESVLGWEELELEVVRDHDGKMITVCFIENVDPMGVHTGDSFCTAPMLTVPSTVQARLQEYAYRIVESVGVIGGTNVQFAHDPVSDRIVVIEINPRTSRSSALASKATGFPIALVSARLAGGLSLAEMPYWRDGTLDRYTPSGDYVVVKFARWAFEKFPGSHDRLGTQMRAVGEVMSIGANFKEAFQKALRSLEIGRSGPGFARAFHDQPLSELLALLAEPSSERWFIIYEALRKGATIAEIAGLTHAHPWFLGQLAELVALEEEILACRGKDLPETLLRRAKLDGFADRYLAKLLGIPETALRERRLALGIRPGYASIPVSGTENAAYYYSSYHVADAVATDSRRKILVLGGGPNRIGQGIEFDYCCVHAAGALREAGLETIMINCNPETVSTDYDTSDRLYFEPLTVEDVLAIYEKEKPEGVIVQFGGQTPLNLADELAAAGVRILGTPPDVIDLAEDRDRFRIRMEALAIPMPESGMAVDIEEALALAAQIGYPLMVRPSYVLGGRGMEIVYDETMLRRYMAAAVGVTPERPILIDRFLVDAVEAEADALADGTEAFVPAVMEHIEQAGIHSGDSACALPPVTLAAETVATIEDYTARIARDLGVVGLLNVQFAVADGRVYVLEANPRASRTVPLVSKVCALHLARLATRLMLGERLATLGLEKRRVPYVGVKEAVLPFSMFPEVDPVLGPEMRSTGEVLGIASGFGLAFFKAEAAAQPQLPLAGNVLFSVGNPDKAHALEAARAFVAEGFGILATEGTAVFLAGHGIPAETVRKVHEGGPNILDAIRADRLQLIVNTPIGREGLHDDSYIRKAAIKHRIPYVTTAAAALAAARGIAARRAGMPELKSLQEWHALL